MITTVENKPDDLRFARKRWGRISKLAERNMQELLRLHGLSILGGDLTLLNGNWYVTHAGLLQVARRKRCVGINTEPVLSFCDSAVSCWAFKAVVYTSRSCKGFVGYGDADPSNVSPQVRGAEMRVAETRAVNRALRKAYGIGICSVEELGAGLDAVSGGTRIPPQSANGNGFRSHPRLRDRLVQLIRQHQLDPVLVKAYAVDFCGAKTLREASRDQVENFIQHLADWAEKDKNALILPAQQLHAAGIGRR